MSRPGQMVRALRRFRDLLAEMMADEARIPTVKAIAGHYGIELYANGELTPACSHAVTQGYYAQFTTDELEALLAFAGALKAHARRPEPGPAKPPPWEYP